MEVCEHRCKHHSARPYLLDTWQRDVVSARTLACGSSHCLRCCPGRNRRCAEEFVKAGGRKTFEQIEKELLNGQKLQGTLTVKEVIAILRKEGSAGACARVRVSVRAHRPVCGGGVGATVPCAGILASKGNEVVRAR